MLATQLRKAARTGILGLLACVSLWSCASETVVSPVPHTSPAGHHETAVVPVTEERPIEESRYIPRYHLNPGDNLSVSFHFGTGDSDLEFHLEAGDKVELKALFHEELNGVYTIRPDGIISLPYKGAVKVAGLTPEDLVDYLTDLYSDIFRRPSFSIQVTAAEQRVLELKALLGRGETSQSIATSLGPDGYISLPLVGEIRATGLTVSQVQQVLENEYQQLHDSLSISVMLTGTAGFGVFVMGEVIDPGRYPIGAPLTASRALALASGPNPETADLEHVVLLTLDPVTGKARASFVDLHAVMVLGDISRDPLIGPNDVLVVPATSITKMDRWVEQYIGKLLLFRGVGASVGYRLEDV